MDDRRTAELRSTQQQLSVCAEACCAFQNTLICLSSGLAAATSHTLSEQQHQSLSTAASHATFCRGDRGEDAFCICFFACQ